MSTVNSFLNALGIYLIFDLLGGGGGGGVALKSGVV